MTIAGKAMPTSVQFGQIVWAELADANGIRKLRPAVVVTPTDRITAAGTLDVVAVTSLIPRPLPGDYVLLPWHPKGHPRTGLNRKCAAVCRWLARIVPSDVRSMAGLVPGSVLLDIVSRIASAGPTPPANPSDE